MPDPLVVCSTFTGVGGMDRGLERAGMRVAMSCELEPVRRRILRRHWPHVPCCPDIRLLGDACDIPTIDEDPESPTYGQTFIRDGSHHPGPIDLLCGGFPCQDVSVAGQRRGTGRTTHRPVLRVRPMRRRACLLRRAHPPRERSRTTFQPRWTGFCRHSRDAGRARVSRRRLASAGQQTLRSAPTTAARLHPWPTCSWPILRLGST